MVVLDTLIGTTQLDFIEHVFKGADDDHVPLDAYQVVLGIAFQFVLDALVVLVDGDGFELDAALLTHILRQDHLTLRHARLPMI